MPSTPSQVLGSQIQRTKLAQVFRSQTREFIQQPVQRLTLTLACLRPAIERIKRPTLAKLQNHFRSRHPVCAFAVDQMAYDFVSAPTVFAFVAQRPRFLQITQQRIECRRSASEQRYRVLQVLFHRAILKTISADEGSELASVI